MCVLPFISVSMCSNYFFFLITFKLISLRRLFPWWGCPCHIPAKIGQRGSRSWYSSVCSRVTLSPFFVCRMCNIEKSKTICNIIVYVLYAAEVIGLKLRQPSENSMNLQIIKPGVVSTMVMFTLHCNVSHHPFSDVVHRGFDNITKP